MNSKYSVVKKLLFLVLVFTALKSFGQNPELFGIWYLTSYSIDLEEPNYISNIQPPISPFLIIGETLDFSGEAACNPYIGNFSYNSNMDKLVLSNFDTTLSLCDFEDHNIFEVDYFSYFLVPGSYQYYFYSDNSGNRHLVFSISSGSELDYQNQPLSVSKNTLNNFKIYPNPVSDQLFVTSEKFTIESMAIFSMTGQKILQIEGASNSINVSSLSKGMYFLEINSEEGKVVQKFIKK